MKVLAFNEMLHVSGAGGPDELELCRRATEEFRADMRYYNENYDRHRYGFYSATGSMIGAHFFGLPGGIVGLGVGK